MQYTVKTPILHNGKRYEAGGKIQLNMREYEKVKQCLEIRKEDEMRNTFSKDNPNTRIYLNR